MLNGDYDKFGVFDRDAPSTTAGSITRRDVAIVGIRGQEPAIRGNPR
jgi:hypothetical protein